MKYYEYKKKQQSEFNKLPMKAAFGNKQFKEMMAEWGLCTSDEDLKKIVSLGYGAYCLEKDKHLFDELLQKHLDEDEEFYKNDAQLEDALIYEFGNHECSYTYDPWSALQELPYTKKEIVENERLARIFNEAWNKYLSNNE